MTKRSCITLAFTLLLAANASAQESLDVAKDLYASADYEKALAVLDKLKTAEPAPAAAIDEYRAYCLLALGRPQEAEAAFGSVVATDPLRKPADTDTSPRTRALFEEVRLRVLPSVVQRQYTEAKASFDAKDYPAAAAMFERLLRVIEDPELPKDGRIEDIATLASGFLDLSRCSPRTAPPATVEAPAAVEKAPVAAPVITIATPIAQRFPNWPAWVPAPQNMRPGAVEVDIDEAGRVVAARIVEAIHPRYDAMLLAEAKQWLFKPAARDGRPMPSTLTVNVVVRPKTP